jgi:hypothetical protein
VGGIRSREGGGSAPCALVNASSGGWVSACHILGGGVTPHLVSLQSSSKDDACSPWLLANVTYCLSHSDKTFRVRCR